MPSDITDASVRRAIAARLIGAWAPVASDTPDTRQV
jgi:hypothetical protein